MRSERAFCEQLLDYNLLFRWFLDMNLIEPSFDATTFCSGMEWALFGEVVLEADRHGLHSTVNGTSQPEELQPQGRRPAPDNRR